MFILIEIAAAASACAAAPAPSAVPSSLCTAAAALAYPPIAGGWRAVATDNEQVQAAAQFAAGQLGGELGSVDEASQQVVAGMNYRMSLSLSDGRKFNVTVYRALNGTYQLTSSDEVRDTGDNKPSDDN